MGLSLQPSKTCTVKRNKMSGLTSQGASLSVKYCEMTNRLWSKLKDCPKLATPMHASSKTSETTGTVGAGGDGAAQHDEPSCRVGCPFLYLQQSISGAVLALPVVATCLHLHHVYISHEHDMWCPSGFTTRTKLAAHQTSGAQPTLNSYHVQDRIHGCLARSCQWLSDWRSVLTGDPNQCYSAGVV